MFLRLHIPRTCKHRKYGVRFITYWFDEVRSTAFCLVEAPNKEAIQQAHDEAHGDVPSEIIEVDPAG